MVKLLTNNIIMKFNEILTKTERDRLLEIGILHKNPFFHDSRDFSMTASN